MLILTTAIVSTNMVAVFADDISTNTNLVKWDENVGNEEYDAILYGTTSKRVLVYQSSGKEVNKEDTKYVKYWIKTYSIYKKAEHSSTWRYSYKEHEWGFEGFTKYGQQWVHTVSKTGKDRTHGDANSILNYYIHDC